MNKFTYVIVVHRRTGRAFTLGRGYRLMEKDVEDYRSIAIGRDQQVTSREETWLPTGASQLPEWAIGRPEAEFTAFWLSEPKSCAA